MAEENKQVEDMEDLMEDDDVQMYWSLKVVPGKGVELPPPPSMRYIIHITNATFGVKVKPNSRTVLQIQANDENDKIVTHPACVLTEGKCETMKLDLKFAEGVTFKLAGKNPSAITLNGYLEEMDVPAPDFDEDMDDEQIQELLRKRKFNEMDEDSGDIDQQMIPDDDDEEESNEQVPDTQGGDEDIQEEESKMPKKKKRKLNKDASPKQSPSKQSPKQGGKTKDLKVLRGGVTIKDMRIGKGDKVVKNGSTVSVKYVGQLNDKSVFDKAISGPGFEFECGAGNVVKGWDIGIKGMRVGGKRRIVVPPNMGYGRTGNAPKIPANATLTFTVEVTKIE